MITLAIATMLYLLPNTGNVDNLLLEEKCTVMCAVECGNYEIILPIA